jgi:hypothetical protein
MNAHRVFGGKARGKGPLGRPRHKWVDNMKMYLRERGFGGMNWIDLAQVRNQWGGGFCEHGNEPSGFIKCWEVPE